MTQRNATYTTPEVNLHLLGISRKINTADKIVVIVAHILENCFKISLSKILTFIFQYPLKYS
ncbi:hypothetical protein BOVMAS18_13700 [Streptococcus uberis]